tara:strand:+ start:163 stop:687 length:525 start_codon:yes stop_codon:yes gene_type:complete
MSIVTPLLTNTFLKFFLNLDLKDKTYLEIGAGNSTIFFSKYFKQVISFEDSHVWYDGINRLKIPNVDLHFFRFNTVFGEETKNKLRSYLKEADYIIIDNDPRRTTRTAFAHFIDKHRGPNSIIILDNGEKNIEALTFLKKKYYCLDFPGKRYDESFSVTSIFFTNHNYDKLLNT